VVSERLRHTLVLVFVTVLVFLSLLVTVGIPGIARAPKTHLGLDLQGGTELVFQARPGPQSKVTSASIAQAIVIIRHRIDQLGASDPQIEQSGGNEIEVQLPNVKNAAQAENIVGETGQLYFYDWEASVIAANGKIAGPNTPRATCDQSKTAAGSAVCGLSEYAAVLRAAAQPTIKEALASAPHGSYYYVDDKSKTVYAPDGGESAPAYLLADIAQKKIKLPQAARLVYVHPGTVIVQATSAPEVLVPNVFYVLRDDAALTGKSISNPQVNSASTQGPAVTFGFNGDGAKIFSALTAVLATRGKAHTAVGAPANEQHFAVTLNGALVTVPEVDFNTYPNGINAANGSEITGNFTQSSASALANVLASGALPIILVPIASQQVSATLGHQALSQGLLAGLIGLLIVAFFLLLFYRVLGVVAVTALGVYGLYFFAIIKLIPVTLTLPGIAGLILTIGVAADANVVIFERVKEEARAGRSTLGAISAGYKRGMGAIIDANIVTLITAFILFTFSQADVQGFALTLGIGVMLSLFTAVVATRAILGGMGRSRVLTRLSALGVSKSQRRWHFDFMGKSKWFFTLSGTILLIGALAIGANGINFGIDFVSGTQISVTLARPASATEVSNVLSGLHIKGLAGSTVQQVSHVSTAKVAGAASFQISSKTLTPAEIGSPGLTGTVEGALSAHFGLKGVPNTTSVGPSFGKTVADSALVAIIASLLAISLYIALRFQWKYAVPVLIALMHDLLITAGVYALTGRQVTASTVAALLTILGYSLYDTIIVFDRVRENVAKMQNAAFSQIVNRSMSEVLTRSLVTSFCTLLPIIALLVFGGVTLKDFAFALMVGVASGAYSSIFIASPVLTHWKEREDIYRRRRVRIAEEHNGLVPAYALATTAVTASVSEAAAPARRESVPEREHVPTPESVPEFNFSEALANLHAQMPNPDYGEGERDPKADARPEDLVMKDDDKRGYGPRSNRKRRRH
jgi:SecD/SecF fusion protein